MLPDILTVEEVGRYLRIGRNSAYDLVRRGLNPIRIGRRRLVVPKATLGAFLNLGGETPSYPHAGNQESNQ